MECSKARIELAIPTPNATQIQTSPQEGTHFMKSSKLSLVFSRLTVISLSISLLCVQTMVAIASPANSTASAEITVSGPRDSGEKAFVVVNGERAFSGRTFISDGTIVTTETSSATISFGKLGRIELAPASSLSLSFSNDQIAARLSTGRISVSNTDGVSVTVNTPHDLVANQGNSASRFTVSVIGERTGVAVESGNVSHNGQTAAKQDDDDPNDDDDYWKAWAWVAVIGGVIGTILIVRALDDEDDVSPVR